MKRSLRFLIVPFLLLYSTSIIAEVTPACTRGIGIAYDERHAFSVDAPSGWCWVETSTEERMQTHLYTWRQIDTKDGPELLLIFDYLPNEGENLEGLIRQDIADWAARMPEEKAWLVQTADNRFLEYRCQELPKTSQYQFIAYTIEENVCAIRMILRASSKQQLKDFEPAFRKFVGSYKRAR